MPELAGLHHVALTVGDVETSLRWYAEVMGAEEVFRQHDEYRTAVVVRFPGNDPILGLVEHRPGGNGGFDPTNVGLDALAFRVASRAELESWAVHLTELGVAYSGVAEIPPGATISFKDPDGIALTLFWNR